MTIRPYFIAAIIAIFLSGVSFQAHAQRGGNIKARANNTQPLTKTQAKGSRSLAISKAQAAKRQGEAKLKDLRKELKTVEARLRKPISKDRRGFDQIRMPSDQKKAEAFFAERARDRNTVERLNNAMILQAQNIIASRAALKTVKNSKWQDYQAVAPRPPVTPGRPKLTRQNAASMLVQPRPVTPSTRTTVFMSPSENARSIAPRTERYGRSSDPDYNPNLPGLDTAKFPPPNTLPPTPPSVAQTGSTTGYDAGPSQTASRSSASSRNSVGSAISLEPTGPSNPATSTPNPGATLGQGLNPPPKRNLDGSKASLPPRQP